MVFIYIKQAAFFLFFLSASLLLLFPLFAVLLNCHHPDPRVFCLFLSIILPIPVGGEVIEQLHGPLDAFIT